MRSTRPHKAIYVALFAVANVLSTWSFDVFGATIFLGSIAMVVAYGLLDIVNDVEGKQAAQRTVLFAGWARAAVFAGLVALSWVWPSAWSLAMASATMFVFAELAMLASQYCVDVPVFDALKRRLRGPFWVRYNVSNLISQPLAAAIFSVGASWAFSKPYLSVLVGALSVRVLALPILLTPMVSAWQPSK